MLALLRSHQLFIRTISPIFKSAGLTSSQWDVLETLYSKGPLSVNDLMQSILSTSGNLDAIVKNLIQLGFVEKTIDETDRRIRIIRLSEAGKTKVENFLPVHNQALAEIFREFTSEEKHRYIKSLNQLRKRLAQPD